MQENTITENRKVEKFKFLQVSPRDKAWGLAVTSAGFHHVHPGENYPSSSHPDGHNYPANERRVINEYLVVYVTRGSGHFESASCSRTKIEAGMMFMVFPGEWHTFAPDPSTGWDDHWIGFNGSFMDDKIRAGFFTFKNCVFRTGVDENITNTFLEILDIVAEEKKGFQQIAAGLTMSLIGRIYYKDLNHSSDDS